MISPAIDEVGVEVDGACLVVTLNRPEKLNAVTPAMSKELTRLAHAVNDDDDIRVVVITGAGERAFCAGSDIRTLDEYATPWEFRNRVDYCDALREVRKPLIAAVNGYAFGGGVETAMICDIRLASENAQLAASEIKLGWIGGGGMSAFLAHSAGASNAALMLLTGEPIDATTAKDWGLVSEVHPQGDLLGRARELAQTIASRAPIAAQTAKANLRAAFTMPFDDAMRYERDLQTICFATEDAAEGRRAFAEKRQATFTGR
ncbi:enoyl-CoA hydratase/isomerase family protein [Microbacterium fluvii]|uniref:Enoyl-CoA hydratase/isomerase family protein n=1 Tax=Microbacterium fluvii TaxID=415215 RepID=A0ABW2HED8_9MICO|nr:enoyl-CoA hydratase-related protein [Microbacterium fluvii]MCU4673073.1 enoyl-CoA hydratase-related protein [Microbacterium fluvii]